MLKTKTRPSTLDNEKALFDLTADTSLCETDAD